MSDVDMRNVAIKVLDRYRDEGGPPWHSSVILNALGAIMDSYGHHEAAAALSGDCAFVFDSARQPSAPTDVTPA